MSDNSGLSRFFYFAGFKKLPLSKTKKAAFQAVILP
jgi:hypothetical protein